MSTMEVTSDGKMPEAHSMNNLSSYRPSSGEGEYYSASTDIDEPISYACLAKKEIMDRHLSSPEEGQADRAVDLKIDSSSPMGRRLNTPDDVYRDHAMDLKVDPSTPEDQRLNSHEDVYADHAMDLKIDPSSPVDRQLNSPEEDFRDHAVDLKIDPSSPVDQQFNSPDDIYMDHAMDLKIDSSSPVDSTDLSADTSSNGDLTSKGGFGGLGPGVGSNSSVVSSSDLNAGNLTLWRFLLDLLLSGQHQEIIQWTSSSGEFMLLQAEEVARLWGLRKNKNHRMTYDKLSRALRYYYQKNIIQKVHGHKFVYRFVNLPNGVLQMCRLSIEDKIPFDLSMATANGGHHNPFRSALNGPLSLLGESSLSSRSLLAKCHADRLSADSPPGIGIKMEQRDDSPHLSSPGPEPGHASPPTASAGPSSSASSSAASSLSLASGAAAADCSEPGPSRLCRCHPQCRQVLPERRSVSCQTSTDLGAGCPLPPPPARFPAFLPPQPAPASVPAPSAALPAHRPAPTPSPGQAGARPDVPATSERALSRDAALPLPAGAGAPSGVRSLQKGLHSLNMQKFAQCIQFQTAPSAHEVMSKLGLPGSSRHAPAASSRHHCHHRHPHSAPYAKQRATSPAAAAASRPAPANGTSAPPAGGAVAPVSAPSATRPVKAEMELSPGAPAPFPAFPHPPPLFPTAAGAGGGMGPAVSGAGGGSGATSPSASANSSSSSFVWVPVHVNMLRLRQQMSAAAAAAAAASVSSSPAHAAALKHFAFPTGGQ